MEQYFLVGVVCVLTVLIIVLMSKFAKNRQDVLLHQKIDSLKEEFTRTILQTQGNFLSTSNAINQELTKLYEKLGSLDQESAQILMLTKSFSDILKPTKTRGVMGETILASLLEDVLPKEVVCTQHGFANGKKVDFAIKIPQGLVPIDAKFSLEAFKNYLDANEQENDRQKKAFTDSVKKRIDETASYIFPDEGTTDFAMMYVPSEAVYYAVIMESSLIDYAHQKRVFIVGPNTFYAYVKTILIGFRALTVEKRAKEIYDSLRRLDQDMKAIVGDCGVLGNHLKNVSLRYEDLRKKIEGVSAKLTSIDQGAG